MKDVMKKVRILSSAVFMGMTVAALGLAGVPAMAQEGADAMLSDSKTGPGSAAVLVAFLDLRAGRLQIKPPQMTVWSPAMDSNSDGFYEAVLRVDLNPALGFTRLCALLDYEGTPAGFTLNIGDSMTNNGFGGDSAHQQRDAEMQILDDDLAVFASDVGGAARIAVSTTHLDDGGLKVCVSDMFLSYGNPYTEHDYGNAPAGADLLYALNGQPDTEGPVNYDIYLGFNRVVFGPGNRIGAGLARVYLTLE